MNSSVDVAVVGHFSIDYLSLPRRCEPCRVMGGAVAFVSLVTRQLGGSVAVISKVGEDFPQPWLERLQQAGVDVCAVTRTQSEHTTSFELQYDDNLENRTLRLIRQGTPLAVSDIPKGLHAKAIHIAPIANEIPFNIIKQLKPLCDVLSIDPQGMTRQFSVDGAVSNSACMDSHVLGLIDVYKSSLNEILLLTGKPTVAEAIAAIHKLGPKIVLVTSGSQGAVLSTEGKVWQIPTCKPVRVVDPTGAGDVFIGAFLNQYIRQNDPYWSACVGSAAASLVVEDVGTSFLGTKEEITRRAESIYKKE
jgi:sugar/nucleoside kinase (ribokinase family)